MKLRVRFKHAAEEHLKDIGWHNAENVAAAVYRFAEKGRGDVERIRTGEVRLRVGVFAAWFVVEPGEDEDEPELVVLAIQGPRPRRRL